MAEKNKNTLESVIGVDTDREIIHFYSMDGGNKETINYHMQGYKAKPFSPEFYDKISNILGQYREDHPDHTLQKVSIVLSDSVALTDTVNLPLINKKAMDSSLAASLSNLYGNSSDLKFNRILALQSKNIATYAISGIRKDILVNLNKAFAAHQISIGNITYASSATTNAALTLNPKIKNDSFVILDIKEEFARLIFVVKGKTLGFYTLPFGYKILYKTRVAPEDLLFDHSSAELTVLNAKERAKAKAVTMAEEELTVASEEPAPQAEENDEDEIEPFIRPKAEDEDDDDEEDFEDVNEEDSEGDMEFITRNRKKPARKLPKFMLRPTPTNREGYMYENFRVFIKWTLEFIAGNPGITALGAPSAVYVNMPEEYSFLYDMTNLEAEDNGLSFLPLLTEQEGDVVKKNLELYGGFFTKQFNGFNNFQPIHVDSHKPRLPEREGKSQQEAEPQTEGKKDIKQQIADLLSKAKEIIKKIATYEIGGKK